MLSPFNADIKSLRATLPAEIFYCAISIFKGLTARRVYKSFGVKGLISPSVETTSKVSAPKKKTISVVHFVWLCIMDYIYAYSAIENVLPLNVTDTPRRFFLPSLLPTL
jgi:hypothetical protein